MFLKNYLECYQKVNQTGFKGFWKIKKNSEIYQEQSREGKREQDTSIYLGSPFHKGYVQCLTPL